MGWLFGCFGRKKKRKHHPRYAPRVNNPFLRAKSDKPEIPTFSAHLPRAKASTVPKTCKPSQCEDLRSSYDDLFKVRQVPSCSSTTLSPLEDHKPLALRSKLSTAASVELCKRIGLQPQIADGVSPKKKSAACKSPTNPCSQVNDLEKELVELRRKLEQESGEAEKLRDEIKSLGTPPSTIEAGGRKISTESTKRSIDSSFDNENENIFSKDGSYLRQGSQKHTVCFGLKDKTIKETLAYEHIRNPVKNTGSVHIALHNELEVCNKDARSGIQQTRRSDCFGTHVDSASNFGSNGLQRNAAQATHNPSSDKDLDDISDGGGFFDISLKLNELATICKNGLHPEDLNEFPVTLVKDCNLRDHEHNPSWRESQLRSPSRSFSAGLQRLNAGCASVDDMLFKERRRKRQFSVSETHENKEESARQNASHEMQGEDLQTRIELKLARHESPNQRDRSIGEATQSACKQSRQKDEITENELVSFHSKLSFAPDAKVLSEESFSSIYFGEGNSDSLSEKTASFYDSCCRSEEYGDDVAPRLFPFSPSQEKKNISYILFSESLFGKDQKCDINSAQAANTDNDYDVYSDAASHVSIEEKCIHEGGDVGSTARMPLSSSNLTESASKFCVPDVERRKKTVRLRKELKPSVLTPIENLAQWNQLKENPGIAKETSDKYSGKKQKGVGRALTFRTNMDGNENTNTEKVICVDVSLAQWLRPLSLYEEEEEEQSDPLRKTTTEQSASKEVESPSSVSPRILSMQGRPLSPAKSPDDRPILGTVASHCSDMCTARKWWDGKGIPNSTNKYEPASPQNHKVNWHTTPFEITLERALVNQGLVFQKKLFGAVAEFDSQSEGGPHALLILLEDNACKKGLVPFHILHVVVKHF